MLESLFLNSLLTRLCMSLIKLYLYSFLGDIPPFFSSRNKFLLVLGSDKLK